MENEVTQRIEIEQPTYRVELSGPDQPVTPGVYVQAMLLIHNLSDEQDRFFIELDGVPRDWVRLERVETVLDPGEQTHLVISFKPLRRPDSEPGEYPFVVRVRSKSRPTQTVDASMVLTVLAYSGFGLDLGRSRIAPGEILPVHIHNQGNGPLLLVFSGRAANGGLAFDFQPPNAMLGPGQRMTIRARSGHARCSCSARAGPTSSRLWPGPVTPRPSRRRCPPASAWSRCCPAGGWARRSARWAWSWWP